MERQDVDRPTLASDPERHLDFDEPVQGAKGPSDLLDEGRVINVEETIEGLAVPAQVQFEAGGQRPGNRIQGSDSQLIGLSKLDP